MSNPAQSMVERIKRRATNKSVPERDTSLTEITTPQESDPIFPEQELKQLPAPIAQPVANLVEVAARRQIRLEINLDEEIDTLCKKSKITPETLFEALYLQTKENTEQLNLAIAQAKKRLTDRKKTGKIRRLQTQMRQENLTQEDFE